MSITCPKCEHENPDNTLFCGKCGTPFPVSGEIKDTETMVASKEELTRGTTFAGRYEIIEELGKGGMGNIYRVEDTKLSQEVALKLIKPEIAQNRKTIERFRNELKTARMIVHKNVCRMFDLGESEGIHFITMEYIPGEDLKSFIYRSGHLAVETAIKIARQVCEGLAEAHHLGVVHRDLKSRNIMIDKEGNVRIMDFGIALSLETKDITGAGMMIGTPEYMSPEQVEGKEIDSRSDIYSLGVILYEMVTGKAPFRGETPFIVGMKHKTERPTAPREMNTQVPLDLNSLILKCLEKDKEQRWQKVEQILIELSRIGKSFTTTKKLILEKEMETTMTGTMDWQNSVAVLPFTDMSPQKDQEYFCDGLAETLINALSNIKDLRVVARTSAFSFKGKDLDIREIGKKLTVNTILEGSVQKADNQVRITAQLINVADGYHIWSDRYDKELKDIFAVQDEIGLAIVENLKGKLLRREREKLLKRHTDNPEAYSLYLKGLYFWNKRTAEAMQKGMECFQQAIETDPAYALAYSGLADSYGIQGFWGFLSPADSFPKAKALAEKALKIDETLAEAHASLAWVRFAYDWDWDSAENEFKKAIKLNPGYAMAHHWYGVYLTAMGRHDEAHEEMKRAHELDPLSLMINLNIGLVDYNQRHYDMAIKQTEKIIEMDQTFGQAHYQMAKTYGMKGMYKEAIGAARKAYDLGIFWAGGVLGWAYGLSGRKDKTKELLYELEELSKKRYVPLTTFYWLYLGLGDLDRCTELFEEAYQARDTATPWGKASPECDVLRSDPRFRKLLKKLNLE